jgi:hypothetical protein
MMSREEYYADLICASFPLEEAWEIGQAVIAYVEWLDSLPEVSS